MRHYLSACLVLVLSSVCPAAVPTLVGKIDLATPLLTLRVTPDGKRAIAVLQGAGDRPAGLQVIDTSQPDTPIPRGFLAHVSGRLALAPDGQQALLLAHLEPEKYNTVTRHVLIAVDLANPDAPQERWRRELLARNVVLADDASAYAMSQPSRTTPNRWQTVITWIDRARPEMVVEEAEWAPPTMQFSARATFLVYQQYGNSLRVFDLRSHEPVLYTQAYTFYRRYDCIPTILASGYLLIEDARAPRLGIYAPQTGVPRVATLAHDGSKHCSPLHGDPAGGSVILADAVGRLHRIDLHQPAKPMWTGVWRLPPATYPLAVAGTLLYAVGGDRGQHIQIFRLDVVVPPVVDWAALAAAHRAAMDRYREDRRHGEPLASFDAIRRLEKAGVWQALEAPVTGIAPQRAAAILNDYGFLAWHGRPESPPAQSALRRAITLAPRRALAVLNLADGLRAHLSSVTTLAAKQARIAEITALYRQYLALGGKRRAYINAFIQDIPARTAGGNICRAIAQYANAGRLQELVSDAGINIPAGARRLDLVFATEGTAHVPTVYAFDADTDIPLADDVLSIPGDGSLWGGDQLGLVLYRDTAHILHYRDFHHPVATAPLVGGAGCRFRAITVQRMGPKTIERALCRRLSTGTAPPALAFTIPAPITGEAVRERYAETDAGGMRLLDVANDGQPVNVAEMALSSGAGPGCDAQFYDLLDEAGQRLASGPKHELLMQLQNAHPSDRYPIPCGNKARFFTYGGKVYFENKPAIWPPVDDADQYHRVARIAHGRVVEVCDFRFETTIAVEPCKGRKTSSSENCQRSDRSPSR